MPSTRARSSGIAGETCDDRDGHFVAHTAEGIPVLLDRRDLLAPDELGMRPVRRVVGPCRLEAP